MTAYTAGLNEVEGIASLLALILLGSYVAHLALQLVRDRRIIFAMGAGVYLDVLLFVVLFAADGYLSNDAQLWHSLGALAAEHLSGDLTAQGSSALQKDGKEGYIWILGGLYFFGGATPALGICLNLIARVTTVAMVAFTTQELIDASGADAPTSERASLIAGFLTALLPAFAIWSPQLLREALTVFLLSCALACAVTFLTRGQIRFVFLMLVPIAVLAWVRQTLGISVCVALLAGLAYTALGGSRHGKALRVFGLIALLPALPLLLRTVLTIIGIDEDRIVGSTSELSETASSGFPGLNRDASVPQVLLITLPRVLAGPFPWELSPSMVMLLAAAELACWIVVLVFTTIGLWQFTGSGPLHRGAWIIPIFAVTATALVVGLSLITGNYGLLARFRPAATMTLIPLATVGVMSILSNTAARRRNFVARAS